MVKCWHRLCRENKATLKAQIRGTSEESLETRNDFFPSVMVAMKDNSDAFPLPYIVVFLNRKF